MPKDVRVQIIFKTERDIDVPDKPFSFGDLFSAQSAGDYQALLVVGTSDNVAGGIVWCWRGDRTVEFFGPYT